MTIQTMTLDDVKFKTVEELLRLVSTAHQVLHITLPDGADVVISPQPPLKQLPILEGYLPQGWKDAIYDHAE